MKEIKLVVSEKYEFECRDLSISREFCDLWTTMIPTPRTKTRTLPQVINQKKSQLFVETFGQEIKSVGLENCEMERRNIFRNKSCCFPLSNNENCSAGNKIPSFLWKTDLILKLCYWTTWWKKEADISGKIEFVPCDEAKQVAHFVIFGLLEILPKEENLTLNRFFHHKYVLIDWDFDVKNHACRYGEVWGWIWRSIKFISTFEKFGLSEFQGGKERKICQLQLSLTSNDFSIQTFFERIVPVLMEKCECECRNKFQKIISGIPIQLNPIRCKKIFRLWFWWMESNI